MVGRRIESGWRRRRRIAMLASAFVARWRAGSKVETAGGVFHGARGRAGAAAWGGAASDAVRASAILPDAT